MHVAHDARRFRPLRSFRRLWHRRKIPSLLVGHHHGKRDPIAFRRPLQIARVGHDARDLGDRTFVVHPPHEDLLTLRLAFREIRDPRSVGRPPGVGPLHEEAVARSVGLDDPELRLPLVLNAVHHRPLVDDLRAVGRDLRVSDPLPIEDVIRGEPSLTGGLLRPRGRGPNDCDQAQSYATRHESPPSRPASVSALGKNLFHHRKDEVARHDREL